MSDEQRVIRDRIGRIFQRCADDDGWLQVGVQGCREGGPHGPLEPVVDLVPADD